MKLSEMESREENLTEDNLKKSAFELQNLSNEELMQRLLKEVATQKEKGMFDYNGLRKTIENMKNYLPESLYRNLLNTLESIK